MKTFQSLTSELNTFLKKLIQLSCLPRTKCCACRLPTSLTWPVYRNVNAEESSLGVGLKRFTSLLLIRNDIHVNPKRREEFPIKNEISSVQPPPLPTPPPPPPPPSTQKSSNECDLNSVRFNCLAVPPYHVARNTTCCT